MCKSRIVIILFLGLVLLSGCARLDAGLIEVKESCRVTNNSGVCSGTMQEVRNENVKVYSDIFTDPQQYGFLNLAISIETGELQVEVFQYGGAWVSFNVTPEEPGSFSGWINADSDGQFAIKYKQVGNRAVKNVIYNFDLQQ